MAYKVSPPLNATEISGQFAGGPQVIGAGASAAIAFDTVDYDPSSTASLPDGGVVVTLPGLYLLCLTFTATGTGSGDLNPHVNLVNGDVLTSLGQSAIIANNTIKHVDTQVAFCVPATPSDILNARVFNQSGADVSISFAQLSVIRLS